MAFIKMKISGYFSRWLTLFWVIADILKTCSKCSRSKTERSQSWFIPRMPGTQKRVKQGKCPRIAPAKCGLGRAGVYIDWCIRNFKRYMIQFFSKPSSIVKDLVPP